MNADAPATRKTFVLDTNVLLHNPNSIFAFGDNRVVIPIVVLEELDRFKSGGNELGRNSRQVARILDRLREQGSLREGVGLESGGVVQVAMTHEDIPNLPAAVEDNLILGSALTFKHRGDDVHFISKDINARIKADAIGLTSEDFEQQKVKIEELYSGWHSLVVAADVIDRFRAGNPLPMSPDSVEPNEFVLLVNEDNRKDNSLGRYHRDSKLLTQVSEEPVEAYSIKPRNLEQRMAMDLLLDDGIRLVSMVGTAGTGKTLLALAVGMTKVLGEETYNKLLVSRPIIPLGNDIGFLPGSKDEKLSHWMGPIFDNLHFILGSDDGDPDDVIKHLVADETVVLEALTYIRGRSISNHFLIVDEAQNLTPHEIKTIISRAGDHTKIVLTGDPYQIDNPYLDANSNGLTYLVEKLRDQELTGHITLQRSERSELSALAADLL